MDKLHNVVISSTPTLSAWPLLDNTALKSILWETLFLDQLQDFSLLFLNSFLPSFLKSKFMKKFLDTKNSGVQLAKWFIVRQVRCPREFDPSLLHSFVPED